MLTTIQTLPWLRILKVLLANVVLGLLLFETLPRLFDLPGLTLEELDPGRTEQVEERRTMPHPYLGYALRPGWKSRADRKEQASHNLLGFRGPEPTIPKPKGVFRVLCLGGSSTYGAGPTSDDSTYPARLEFHLNEMTGAKVEVVNLGVKGWTSTESLINLCLRGVELEPDLVLVYHATNDALAALWPEPKWDQSHYRRVWTEPGESALESLLERSRTYLIARAYLTDFLDQRLALNLYTVVGARSDYHEPDFDRDIPRRGVQTFARNLKQIAIISQSHGSKVIFIRQAFNPEEGLDTSAHGGVVRKRAIDLLLTEQNRVATKLAIPVIDAAYTLQNRAKKDLEESGRQRVFTNNVHLTNRGADFLANFVANAILQRKLTRLTEQAR